VNGTDGCRSWQLCARWSTGRFKLLWIPRWDTTAHHTDSTRPYAWPIDSYDAILVGGGHNALVAATYLARAGWRTVVLEQSERLGGAVMSAEITLPGFVHDLFSTNQNTFYGGLVYGELGEELERHGLRYATTDKPFANAFPGGKALKVYKDPGRTLAGLREHDPGDAAGWTELKELFDRFSPMIFDLYGSRHGPRTWASAPSRQSTASNDAPRR